jgi:hypothetical protein
VARDLKRLVEEVKEARAEFEARLDDTDIAKEHYYETVRSPAPHRYSTLAYRLEALP